MMTGPTVTSPERSKQACIEVQYAISAEGLPDEHKIRAWAEVALESVAGSAELVVRVVDRAEITALNLQYRGKDSVTNVLSFPCDGLPGIVSNLLGDVVVCAPVVASESVAQGKSLESHWAHLVMHGVLHLRGYTHDEKERAGEMEALEQQLMAAAGFPDPYQCEQASSE